jgi:hypothetical protein
MADKDGQWILGRPKVIQEAVVGWILGRASPIYVAATGGITLTATFDTDHMDLSWTDN